MSGGSKQTTTSELKLPEWLNQGAQTTFQGAQAAAAANPIKAYTGPTAAGSNANLDAAGQQAMATGGVGQADLDRARALTEKAAGGTTPQVGYTQWNPQTAASYMNPELAATQGRTIEEMQRLNKAEIAGVGDQAQGSKAFGGTRHAVLEAETRKGQNSNMLDYLAASNKAAYDDAYGKFNTDRGVKVGVDTTNAGNAQNDMIRTLQAANQSAGIGSTASGMNTDAIANLVKTGAIDQQTAQGLIDGDYNEFLRMQDAPLQRYKELMGMLSGAQTNRTQTETTQTKKGFGIGEAIGLGTSIASLFSDRRLKRDIKLVGVHHGLGIYRYRYAWNDEPQIGVMADEVAQIRPDAVGNAFGFATVDYSKL